MEPATGMMLGLGILLALAIAACFCYVGYARKRQAEKAAAMARAKARARAQARRHKKGKSAGRLSAQQQALLNQKLRNEQARRLYWEEHSKDWIDLQKDPAYFNLPGNDYYFIMEDNNK